MSFRTEEALIALRQISRATASDSRKLAKESGLAVSQLLTLQEISRVGSISPSKLAKQVSLSRGTMTLMLRKLEALGMISREADENDKRSYFVALSEKGSAAIAGAPTLLHEIFSSRFARLENWEQACSQFSNLAKRDEKISCNKVGAPAIAALPFSLRATK